MLKVTKEHLDELLKKHSGHGRTNGTKNIPPIVREVIAKTAQIDTVRATSEAFGVSHSRAQALSEGVITRENGNDASLTNKVDKFIEKAQEQAAEKLLHTLNVITPEEIGASSLKEKLNAADKLAGVVNKLRPNVDLGVSVKDSNVVIYRPEQKKESDYDVVNT